MDLVDLTFAAFKLGVLDSYINNISQIWLQNIVHKVLVVAL